MSSVRMRLFQCHAPSVSVTGSEMIFTDGIFTAVAKLTLVEAVVMSILNRNSEFLMVCVSGVGGMA
jgi:propanediol dehydratase large subunit